MPRYFLLIETSSDTCSVAVTTDNEIVVKLENDSRDHSARLAPMVKDAMSRAGLLYRDLSCIGVNGGPGSYTGLRIGLSTAKGLCFAASVPLILIDALTAYANALVTYETIAENEIIATVDNRRDELFYAVFDSKLNRLQDVTLTVGSDKQLKERLGGKCVVVGSAVNKLSSLYPQGGTTRYANVSSSASNLLNPVLQMYDASRFADLAYSEPLYYKEVYIAPTKSR